MNSGAVRTKNDACASLDFAAIKDAAALHLGAAHTTVLPSHLGERVGHGTVVEALPACQGCIFEFEGQPLPSAINRGGHAYRAGRALARARLAVVPESELSSPAAHARCER